VREDGREEERKNKKKKNERWMMVGLEEGK
jgi:hypothetical protein